MTLYRAIIDFITHYRSLFLNPAGNSNEIVILTAMLIIGAVILWMGAGVLMNGLRGLVRYFRQFTRPWLTLGLVGTGLVLSGAVVIGGLFQVTGSSSFCGRLCHSMNPEFQSWRQSKHADVPCTGCHADNTFPAVFGSRLGLAVHGVAPEATGEYSKPINAKGSYGRSRIPDSRCRACHEKVKDRDVDEFNLRIEHGKHVKRGIRCADCHNRVAHAVAEKYDPLAADDSEFSYRDNTSMSGCQRCHKKGGRYLDEDGDLHKGPYKKIDGTPVAVDCESCHPKIMLVEFEAEVKKVRRRHFMEPPWKRGVVHGETARKVDFKLCQVCHNPKTKCTICHQGITMPHQEDWINPREHGAKAKQVQFKPCRICHTVGTVPRCAAAGHHHEPFIEEFDFDLAAADWKSGKQRHGVVAKAKKGAPCYRCHDRNTWCATQCHRGIAMTHDSNWRNVHFTYVPLGPGGGWPSERRDSKNAPCVMCHANNEPNSENAYCNRCHHSRFGGLNPIAMMELMRDQYGITPLLDTGVRLPCEDCHIHEGLDFCRDCHKTMGLL